MAALGVLLRTGARRLHGSAAARVGSEWRLQQGMAANPSGYGPLTELPDWSYAGERRSGLMAAPGEHALQRAGRGERVERGVSRWRYVFVNNVLSFVGGRSPLVYFIN
uniref:Large ribosomal subunit protein mL52 n=1 Tax=Pipistrellus kuhlii TaxID=59472 RepID=A0A7J8B394_PIPKU|nr:mitochondrial ribosomal protein L52 [Pipistrellus kuhlii]